MTTTPAEYRIKDDSEYQLRLEIELRGVVKDVQAIGPDELAKRVSQTMRPRPGDWGALKPTGTIKPRPCVICGKPFKGNSVLSQTCSNACYKKRDRIRKREVYERAKRQRSTRSFLCVALLHLAKTQKG